MGKISQNLSSESLFHFIRQRDWLVEIIERKAFQARFVYEELPALKQKLGIPMKCFCDIPPSARMPGKGQMRLLPVPCESILMLARSPSGYQLSKTHSLVQDVGDPVCTGPTSAEEIFNLSQCWHLGGQSFLRSVWIFGVCP